VLHMVVEAGRRGVKMGANRAAFGLYVFKVVVKVLQ